MKLIKKIPYGESDFIKIQNKNYYYVDKTKYIKTIEDSPSFLFLIRPRRFGKSLFLSILECYYDINYKQDFEKIFKNTYIGKNPTGKQNTYLILKFNFAVIDPKIENTKESFDLHCENAYLEFVDKYKNLFSKQQIELIKSRKTNTGTLETILNESKKNRLKIYTIIDEYDNFTNSLLARYGTNKYSGITDEDGFFKHFFNVIKSGTTASNASISKIFITGVSPITLDDVTSGGIGHNITSNIHFNEVVGFTDEEVKNTLLYYKKMGKISLDINIILKFMTKWYNNYKFSRNAKQTVYNSTMVFNFILRFMQEDDFPIELIDDNTKIDYTKLQHLLILDKKLNGNFAILREIIEKDRITANLQTSFSVKDMNKRDNFISLLFYFGLITIIDFKKRKHILEIPNFAIKDFFARYIKDAYEDAEVFKISLYKYANLITDMAYDGNWKEVFMFLSEAIKEQTKIRDYIMGEHMIKGFLLAYLNLTNDFIVTSEKELNKGFADLWLAPMVTTEALSKYSYLIELKYNKRTDIKKINIKNSVKQAKEQLNKYENDKIIISEKETTILKKIVLVYNAWELIHMEEIR